mgnify:CR=1 FL=1
MSQSKNSRGVAEIVAYVKQNIIFGRMRPRERLIEEDLTNQFGVSRHVVRAAVVELEQLGLVTRRPNKGAMVRDFSVEEVEQIYDIRAFLQSEAARRIPMPASKELLDEIRDPDPLHQRKGVIADMDGPRWPMSRLVRYLVLEQKARMRPTLGTIICAYVPSDAPALLDDPALMQYHNEMRVELLRHPARCEVDLELIPDPVYRNAMAAAQAQINCGAVMAAPGGPTPKGNRAPTVDPDAAPEPPGGDQGAPESEFGGTGGGAGVVEALMVGGGLAALWALFG